MTVEPIDLSDDLVEVELMPGSEAWWLNEVEVLDETVRSGVYTGEDVADLIHACFEHDEARKRAGNWHLVLIVVSCAIVWVIAKGWW